MATKPKKFPIPRIITAYGEKKKNTATVMGTINPVKQSFREQCDINHILKAFTRTGVLTHLNPHSPTYAYAGSASYQDGMQIVANANSMFEQLPAKIRKEFDNDPANFLAYVEDPENETELQKMGLFSDSLKSDITPLPKKSEATIPEGDAKKPVPSPDVEGTRNGESASKLARTPAASETEKNK